MTQQARVLSALLVALFLVILGLWFATTLGIFEAVALAASFKDMATTRKTIQREVANTLFGIAVVSETLYEFRYNINCSSDPW